MKPANDHNRLSEADFARFRDLVRLKSGLVVTEQRRPDLERVVAESLAAQALPNVAAYYQLLLDPLHGRPVVEALIAALTIGETHFFRNQPQFEALANTILPELIARRRAEGELRLRLWSAGCASGEEPYSLAILLERLLPDLAKWHITILATDINPPALAKAQRGLYTRWSFREVPPNIQASYFIDRDGTIELAARLLERVTFAYLNLVEDAYPSLLTNTQAMDLILCRNVLIYFDMDTISRVTRRLYDSLVDDGWLLVGHTEPPQAIFSEFVSHNLPGTVVYRKVAGPGAGGGQPAALAHHAPQPTTRPRPAALAHRAGTTASLSQTEPLRPTKRPPPVVKPPAVKPPAVKPPAVKPPAVKPLGYRVAQALWQAGHVDEALPQLELFAASELDDGEAASQVAAIYANRQQLDQAEKWISLALQRDPLRASAHYLRGLILQERGQPQAALEALRRCVYIDPQFVLGHFALVGLQTQQKHFDRARKALDNVARLLDGVPREDLVAGGDGLTAGRLLELAAVQRELL